MEVIMKGNKEKRLLDYGIAEIERVAPFGESVELDFKEDAKGHVFSFIKVKVNHRLYVAKKEGRDMYESFHKALRALKAQLAKNKVNHRVNRKLAYQLA
jgi:ribosome-associated translation inhibitor RaiA